MQINRCLNSANLNAHDSLNNLATSGFRKLIECFQMRVSRNSNNRLATIQSRTLVGRKPKVLPRGNYEAEMGGADASVS